MKKFIYAFLMVPAAVALLASCDLATELVYPKQSISNERISEIHLHYPNVQDLSLTNHGVPLQGWYFANGGNGTNVLICFGGNAEEASTMIDVYSGLRGYDYIFFNYRSYGRSGGTPSEKNLFSDALFIYDWAVSRLTGGHGSISLVGRSLGTGIAVHTASLRKPEKIVLLTPFDSLEQVARRHYPGWMVSSLLTDSYKSTKFIRQVKCPVIMIVAGSDMLIPPEHAKTLFNVTPEPKLYVTIKGATHNNIYNHEETWIILSRFLKN